ncbi:MAG: hypothetical protein HON90_09165 [Halobacteriovoraceae bacterium]|nr:hypothetical protein [Halobacteriovoraceae bacterium]
MKLYWESRNSKVINIQRNNNDLKITIFQNRESILIINQTYDENWTSSGNGSLFPINYLQTGLKVTGKGEIDIELSYWPKEWTLGFIIMILGLALAGYSFKFKLSWRKH